MNLSELLFVFRLVHNELLEGELQCSDLHNNLISVFDVGEPFAI